VDRRTFFGTLAGGLLAAPLAAEGQPGSKVHRVGYLSTSGRVFESFRQGLRELGYVEGQNLLLDVRLAHGRLDRLPALAAELVRMRPDVIAAVSSPAIRAIKHATTTIPIVMAFIGEDPVRLGIVENFARPGGNITGVAMIAEELTGKRVVLLREMLPRATRIAVLTQIGHESAASQTKAAQETAKSLGVEIDVARVHDSREYEAAFAAIVKQRTSGLFVVSNPTFFGDQERLAALATKHRLPMMCEWREMAEAGCLMAYGPIITDLYRRAAGYVDRILKGAKPADLPVEQPTKFELVINLKTAKALGLTIPQALLQRADQVIE
jgi:putative ABC transport system substrate-binding protein